jgi:hypothetical protein
MYIEFFLFLALAALHMFQHVIRNEGFQQIVKTYLIMM